MFLFKKITHGALVVALSFYSTPYAAWASPAAEIALKNKSGALGEEAQLVEGLKEIRARLAYTLDEIERLEAKDYSNFVAGVSTGAGGVAVVGLLPIVFLSLADSRIPKAGRFISKHRLDVAAGWAWLVGFKGAWVAGLAGIGDLLLSKNVDYKDLNQKIDTTLLQLEAVGSGLDLESQGHLDELAEALEEARKVASVEKRQEVYKRLLVAGGAMLGVAAYGVGLMVVLMSSNNALIHQIEFNFGLALASAAIAYSGLIGEDKELVIGKLQEAISVLDEAILSVESN